MNADLINALAADVHNANKKWWTDLETGLPIQRSVPEMLMLVVTELAEGMEGYRKNLYDTHLPNRKMLEVELADAVIRIFDIAAGLGMDLGGAYCDKLAYNAIRRDHTIEARREPNGKKC